MCAPETGHSEADDALYHCSYGCWYPRYAAVAPASRVIDLEQGATDFLHEDGLVLHEESQALPQRSKPGDIIVSGVDYDPDDLYSSSSSSSSGSDSGDAASDDERAQPWSQRFPALHAAVAAAIVELGGAVAPRFNWSSPTDALWLSSSNSLRCTNPDEVLLLLKASDRVAHDLELLQQLHNRQQQQHIQQQQPPQEARVAPPANGSAATSSSSSSSDRQQQQQQGLPAQLVLRAWAALSPEWQFRVFVAGHRVMAISQRDPSQHFPQLATAAAAEGQQHSLASIRQRVLDFHARHIGSSFVLGSYTMDVYVPSRGPVQLLDFSPIAATTSPLCFDWEELPYTHMHQQQRAHSDVQQEQLAESEQQQQQVEPGPGHSSRPQVELRVVEHEGMIVPGSRAATGMPYDMLGLPDAVSAVVAGMQQQQQL